MINPIFNLRKHPKHNHIIIFMQSHSLFSSLTDSLALYSIVIVSILVNIYILPITAHPVSIKRIVEGDVAITKGIDINVTTHSKNSVIDWNDLNISKNQSLCFKVPSRHSIVLNRVLGNKPSIVQGNILSRDSYGNPAGVIFLSNSNGFVFGPDSIIDVGSLGVFASEVIKYSEIIQGGVEFDYTQGKISSFGEIFAGEKGFITFVASNIDSSGKITAKGGSVNMIASKNKGTYYIEDDKFKFVFNKSFSSTKPKVLNLETARKNLTNLTNIEQGDEVKLIDGELHIVSNSKNTDRIDISGDIDVSGYRGGRILMEAGNISINNINTSASGTIAPGKITIGNQLNTENIIIEEKSNIDVDSYSSRQAGEVNANAKNIIFKGSIHARGFQVEQEDFISLGGIVSFSGEKFNLQGTVNTLQGSHFSQVGRLNINSTADIDISTLGINPSWIAEQASRNNIFIDTKSSDISVNSALMLPNAATCLTLSSNIIKILSPIISSGVNLDIHAHTPEKSIKSHPLIFNRDGSIDVKKGYLRYVYSPIDFSNSKKLGMPIYATNFTTAYWIKNTTDWMNISKALDKQYVVGNDIDFIGHKNIMPISIDFHEPFVGSIDGNGHVLSNAKITDDFYNSINLLKDKKVSENIDTVRLRKSIGIFGYFNGDIKDMIFDRVTITAKDNYNIGGIAGTVMANGKLKNLVLKNLHITAGINSYIGGLAGLVNNNSVGGDISHVTVESGNISGSYGSYVGGIIGCSINSTFNSMVSDIHIKGVGGIVDKALHGIQESGIGGIVGYAYRSKYLSSFAYGDSYGGEYSATGGFAGILNITNVDASGSSGKSIAGAHSFLGGFVGMNIDSSIALSYSSGDVGGFDDLTSRNITQGGFFGLNRQGVIHNNIRVGTSNIGANALQSFTGGFGGVNQGAVVENISSDTLIPESALSYTTEGAFIGLNTSTIVHRNYYEKGLVYNFQSFGIDKTPLNPVAAIGLMRYQMRDTAYCFKHLTQYSNEQLIRMRGMPPYLKSNTPRMDDRGKYSIRNVVEMQLIAINHKGTYELKRDLFFNQINSNKDGFSFTDSIDRRNIIPGAFQGNFHGGNFGIYGVNLLIPSYVSGGVFENIHNAMIHDIMIDGKIYVSDFATAGMLASQAFGNNVIKNANVNIDINVGSNSCIGGIIGKVNLGNTAIQHSALSGTITSRGNHTMVGGLIGISDNISISHSTVKLQAVSKEFNIVGGLIAGANCGVDVSYSLSMLENIGPDSVMVGSIFGYGRETLVSNSYWLDSLLQANGAGTVSFDSFSSSIPNSHIGYLSSYKLWKFATNESRGDWAMAEYPISIHQHRYDLSSPESFALIVADPSGEYHVTKSVDFSNAKTWGNGFGFGAIGVTFSGKLFGHGHTINNFYSSWPERQSSGLFPVAQHAVIENISLSQATVINKFGGESNVGLLVGAALDTAIENVTVSGTILSNNNSINGGIAASLDHLSSINFSQADITINSGSNSYSAPLVAFNHGSINHSIVKYSVIESEGIVGGFVAINADSGKIFDSVAISNYMLKGSNTAAFVYENRGEILGALVDIDEYNIQGDSFFVHNNIGKVFDTIFSVDNKVSKAYVEDKGLSFKINPIVDLIALKEKYKVLSLALNADLDFRINPIIHDYFRVKIIVDNLYMHSPCMNIIVPTALGGYDHFTIRNKNSYSFLLDKNIIADTGLITALAKDSASSSITSVRYNTYQDELEIKVSDKTFIESPKNFPVSFGELHRGLDSLAKDDLSYYDLPIAIHYPDHKSNYIFDSINGFLKASNVVKDDVLKKYFFKQDKHTVVIHNDAVINAPLIINGDLVAKEELYLLKKPVRAVADDKICYSIIRESRKTKSIHSLDLSAKLFEVATIIDEVNGLIDNKDVQQAVTTISQSAQIMSDGSSALEAMLLSTLEALV